MQAALKQNPKQVCNASRQAKTLAGNVRCDRKYQRTKMKCGDPIAHKVCNNAEQYVRYGNGHGILASSGWSNVFVDQKIT